VFSCKLSCRAVPSSQTEFSSPSFATRSLFMRRVTSAGIVWALLIGFSVQPARADVKLPALFSDGMVLQSGTTTPIWGWADRGEDVSVVLDLKNGTAIKPKPVQASAQGRWEVTFAEGLVPGGPYNLTVSGKNQISLGEVYIGEVWICSGQSN